MFQRNPRRHFGLNCRTKVTMSGFRRLRAELLEARAMLAADPYLAHNIVSSRENQDGGPFKLLTHLVDLTPVLAPGRTNLDDELRLLFGITSDSPGGNGLTDTAVAGDWDGNGYDEIGVVRIDGPGLHWFLNNDFDTDDEGHVHFGLAGDLPVVADFSNSGRDDIGVVRANGGALEWFFHYQSGDYPTDGRTADLSAQFRFGNAGDIPLAGDFNGDGKDDIAVVRVAAGALRWEIHFGAATWPAPLSTTVLSIDQSFNLGSAAQVPIVGDWDGDGDVNWGVVSRAPNLSGTGPLESQINDWFLDRDSNGTLETTFEYGFKNDQFLSGRFNHAPVATPQSVSATEDTQKAITLAGTDADIFAQNIADFPQSLTYTIVSGPSHGSISGGTGANRTYTPAGDYFGPDSFTFKVNDGAVDSVTTATVTINVASVNDLPTANAGGAYTVAEAGTTGLSGTGSDIEGGVSLVWDLDGDGVFGETGEGAVRGIETGNTPVFNAANLDGPTTRTITLRVTDSNNAPTLSTAVVSVHNVAPTANAGGPYQSTFGSTLQLAGTATDPAGALDPLTFTWDLDGDGIFGEANHGATRGNETGMSPVFNPAGLTPGSTYNVTLRVTDNDGGVDQTTAAITVGAPAKISGQKWHDINGNGQQDLNESGLNGWTIEFVNQATSNVVGTAVTASVDLNFDSSIDPLTEMGIYNSPDLAPGTYIVREVLQPGWQQSYPLGGTHQVTVTGGLFFAGAIFGNRLINFYVTTFTPTATGFTAQFNHELNPGELNLYDQENLLGAADVTVRGAVQGAIRGSLVVDSALRQVTFVKTGGPLVDDTYTVTLRSATSAFKDSAGLLLDGNNDEVGGDDFQANFSPSVSPASAVVLSIADFTRGYGQEVNVPAGQTSGIPITISSAAGVKSVAFDLHYDPSLLNITGASLAPGISGALNMTTPSPGTIHLAVSGDGALSTISGPQSLVKLTAHVPQDAPYTSKQWLDLANLQVLDTSPVPQALATIDDDGIHVAAYFGDANGSQSYNSPDATQAQRIIVGIDSGIATFKLVDPRLIVDINENGQIQSDDVTLIQRAIVGLSVPPIPGLPGLPPQSTFQANEMNISGFTAQHQAPALSTMLGEFVPPSAPHVTTSVWESIDFAEMETLDVCLELTPWSTSDNLLP